MKFWSPEIKAWKDRSWQGVRFTSGDQYIVPVDKIPTDVDAVLRPEVMVRDGNHHNWQKSRLYGVIANVDYPFLVCNGTASGRFKHCRFPYPGE